MIWLGEVLGRLALKYVWYLIGAVAIAGFLSYEAVKFYEHGKAAANAKIDKQTERVVKDRKKVDDKVSHLSNDRIRHSLNDWVRD